MNDAWVTVVIPTFGRNLQIVSRAALSALAQTYLALDIVIVDDNEFENQYSKEIKVFCESTDRISYFKNVGNHGACAARNLGGSVARGEYIAFLDDDDEWMPNKIEHQLQQITDDVVMVYCNGLRIDVRCEPPQVLRYRDDDHFKDTATFASLLHNNFIGTTTQFVVRRTAFIKIDGFDESLLARQDYDLCLRLSQIGRLVGVNELLFNHYIHGPDQISQSSAKSLQGYKCMYIKYYLELRNNTTARCRFLWKISRMARLEQRYITCVHYYFKSLLCDPKQWRIGLMKIYDSKPV